MLTCPNCTYAPDPTEPGRGWEQCDECYRLEHEADAEPATDEEITQIALAIADHITQGVYA